MLATYIASKNPRDTSCNSIEIQDGGQSSKWLSAMYNCISLISNYKVDTHVKMYYDEYIVIKYISFKLNENQDGHQIPKCLPKTDWYTLSQVLMWTTVFRFRKPTWKFYDILYFWQYIQLWKWRQSRFHFHLESKMAAKTQNGCRQCVVLTIASCEQSRENWMLV